MSSQISSFDIFCERVHEAGITIPLPLIQLTHEWKSPSATGKLKLDNEELDPRYRLSEDEARKFLLSGINIGVYGAPNGIEIHDIDLVDGSFKIPVEKLAELIKIFDTLTVRTRTGGLHFIFKNCGIKGNPHIYYFGEVDAGEVRRDWQYVVAPGSYVPKEKVDPKKKDRSINTKGFTDDANGYYTIIHDAPIRAFDKTKIPEWYTFEKGNQTNSKQDVDLSGILNPLTKTISLTDEEIIEKASNAKNSQEFLKLFRDGDSSGYNGDSRSEADLALANLLAFYTDSDVQIAGIMRRSRLSLKNEKYQRPDYLLTTISKATSDKSRAMYTPGYLSVSSAVINADVGKTEQRTGKVSEELLEIYRQGGILKSSIDKYEGDAAIEKYALALTFNTFTKKKINLNGLSKRCRVSATKITKTGEVPAWGLTDLELKKAQTIADKKIDSIKKAQSEWKQKHVEASLSKASVKPAITNHKLNVDTSREAYTLTEHSEMCIKAIVEIFNKPQKQVFIRNGLLSKVFYDEKYNVKIVTINKEMVRNILDRCCNFIRFEKSEGGMVEVKARPPIDVCENILATTGLHTFLPPLLGITESPYITSDGKVITDPGYNENTALYFIPSLDYVKIEVPEIPTQDEIDKAVTDIDDLFSDFEFEDAASKDNLFAAVLTCVLRPTINGCTPLYLVDKPQMGTGGSLVCEILNRISTGKALEPSDAPKANDSEEWEKRIVSFLASGTPSVCFDNIESNFQSSSLASVLTARSKKCRVLGSTNDSVFVNNINWMGNGININVGGDLPRRVYLTRIVTNYARPQMRTGFKIPNIKEHVSKNRYKYIRDILIIAKAYHNAGCPDPKWRDKESQKEKEIPAMGSFEEWRRYIGGMMVMINKTSFLGNNETILENSETLNVEGEQLLMKINEIMGEGEFTSSDIIKHQTHIFDEFIPPYILENEKSAPKKLGKFFSHIKGRVFSSGYKIVASRNVMHVQKWVIKYTEQQTQTTL